VGGHTLATICSGLREKESFMAPQRQLDVVMEVMIVACVDVRKLFVKLRVGRLVILGVGKCLGLTADRC
jgi:hypothetical protein